MSRSYVKKDTGYWEGRKQLSAGAQAPQATAASSIRAVDTETYKALLDQSAASVAPVFAKDHFTALAACGGGTGGSVGRNTWANSIADTNAYRNISSGVIPFTERNGGYSMGAVIDITLAAYFNVSQIRNAIDLYTDFSIGNLRVKCPNKTVKKFFLHWFETIGLSSFQPQFFREYYRSGNVFIYKFNGAIAPDKFKTLETAFSAKSPELPIRYIILNPGQMSLQIGPTYAYNFSKMLSTYELQRLRDPQTPEDKQVLKSFPKYIQEQIKNYGSYPYIWAPLDTKRLYYVFYRKQDYEPLAVPMVWPVLNDIEWMLELKRMDMSMARMVEQALLLVTAGAPADDKNPPMGKETLQRLQAIFQNNSVGRVLVSDWTTKMEWKIPDLKELLGPAKYEVVNKYIKEGLQFTLFGDEKFATASIKAKMFVQVLSQGRQAFLNDFLRPEIKKVCEAMGFRNIPLVEFEEINLEDGAVMNRIYAQMAQLGLLTPDQLNDALKTGILPTREDSEERQAEYKTDRDKGYYMPLVGGPKEGEGGPNGRPAGSKAKQTSKKISPVGTSRASIQLSQAKIVETLPIMDAVRAKVEKAYQKAFKLKKLDGVQGDLAAAVARSIVVNEPQDKWDEAIASYIKDPKDIPVDIANEIDGIRLEFEVDEWTAILLHKARIEEAT
jgi:hypothetical protein